MCVTVIWQGDFVTSGNAASKTDSRTLAVDQTSIVCRKVKILVNSIADSRCPSLFECIWAGQAKVQLKLSKKDTSRALELIIGAEPRRTG